MLLSGALASEAASVSFSVAEGYTDGELRGQNGWVTPVDSASQFIVDAVNSRLLVTGGIDYQMAAYGDFLNPTEAPVSTMTTSFNFSFTQVLPEKKWVF